MEQTQIIDYSKYKKTVTEIAEKYPFVNITNIGKSCMGRDIPVLLTGNGETVLMAGAFHGSEYITGMLLLKFFEQFCAALKNCTAVSGINVKNALKNRSLAVIPFVNPDGCEIAIHGKSACGVLTPFAEKISGGDYTHWNSNARGVDINHNFDAGFYELRQLEKQNGIHGPSMTKYGGCFPESEPETKALTEFCRMRYIRHAVAFHSQGEVIYWRYGDSEPNRSHRMAEIMSASSGYALSDPEGTAISGGFKDWFIKEFNRPAFTVEVGKGQNPLPLSDFESIYKKIEEMLILSVIM